MKNDLQTILSITKCFKSKFDERVNFHFLVFDYFCFNNLMFVQDKYAVNLFGKRWDIN